MYVIAFELLKQINICMALNTNIIQGRFKSNRNYQELINSPFAEAPALQSIWFFLINSFISGNDKKSGRTSQRPIRLS